VVNQEARAYKTWNILVALAPRGTLIFYADLAKKLGTHPRAVRFVLALIQDYCRGADLPPLTILVVNKHTKRPGVGFTAWSHGNLREGRAEVRNHAWAKEPNPFAYAADGTTRGKLVNRTLAAPETSQEVYAKVKVRGARQMIFRQALMKAYGGCYALTGVSFAVALDAAHIVPWSQCTPDLKMNPRNGILMLCCHHRLFDLGILSIDEDYKVVFVNRNGRALTRADRSFVAALHGQQISLPTNVALRPDKNLIRQRNSGLGLPVGKELNARTGRKGVWKPVCPTHGRNLAYRSSDRK
jgi:putative restriction endonuclease